MLKEFFSQLIEWARERQRRIRFARCLKQAGGIVGSYRALAPIGFDPVCGETMPSDVIVPSIFTPYAIERTATLSAFWQSGVIAMEPQFADLATGGGKTVNMPFWQDLVGYTSQPLSSTGSLTTNRIAASGDAAIIHERGAPWSDNDLAGIYAGDDPAMAVGELVGDFWSRDMQTMLLNMLKGVFGSAAMSGNLNDIYLASGSTFTDANFLNGITFIDTQSKLGDAAQKLVAIAMHSAVYFSLRKNDLIDFIPESQSAGVIQTFQGLRVIVDDGMTTETINSATVYHTVLFGAGAVAFGVGRKDIPIRGRPGSTWETEFDRVSLAGQNIFINRRRFILHPRGVKWVGTPAGDNATNAELAVTTNWLRVFEAKNVRMVRVRHNIANT